MTFYTPFVHFSSDSDKTRHIVHKNVFNDSELGLLAFWVQLDIAYLNKPHLFSLTQHRFILI